MQAFVRLVPSWSWDGVGLRTMKCFGHWISFVVCFGGDFCYSNAGWGNWGVVSWGVKHCCGQCIGSTLCMLNGVCLWLWEASLNYEKRLPIHRLWISTGPLHFTASLHVACNGENMMMMMPYTHARPKWFQVAWLIWCQMWISLESSMLFQVVTMKIPRVNPWLLPAQANTTIGFHRCDGNVKLMQIILYYIDINGR